jgi:hypothetical protein
MLAGDPPIGRTDGQRKLLAAVGVVGGLGVLFGVVGLLIPFSQQTCNPTTAGEALLYGAFILLGLDWWTALIAACTAKALRAPFVLIVIAIPIISVLFIIWGVSAMPSTDHCNFQL